MGTTDTKIFDKETLLDLTVNFVPLGILLFFIVYVLFMNPWGWDPLVMTLTLGLHVVPFVALAILTYYSGKAIAGSEKEGEVYLAGRASVTGAQPLEAEHHDGGDHSEIGEPDAAATAAAAGDAGAAEQADEDEGETATPDEPGAEGETGTEDEIETGTADEAGTRDASEGIDTAENQDEDEGAK